MRLAVQNGWGGPESEDKRDWLAGAISEMFENQDNLPDVLDVEDVLLQVMQDEFDVSLEDDSAVQIAEEIEKIYGECSDGDYKSVQSLYEKFQKQKGKIEITSSKQSESDSSETLDEDESDMDMESGEDIEPGVRSILTSRRVIDDEGFELVQGRR